MGETESARPFMMLNFCVVNCKRKMLLMQFKHCEHMTACRFADKCSCQDPSPHEKRAEIGFHVNPYRNYHGNSSLGAFSIWRVHRGLRSHSRFKIEDIDLLLSLS